MNESKDGYELEFDLIGVEAPIANTLRRVLIAEVRRRRNEEERVLLESPPLFSVHRVLV